MTDNNDNEELGVEQGFNDDELKDIMAEIEDLEKDLDSSHSSISASSEIENSESHEHVHNDLDDDLDEVQMSDDSIVEDLIEDIVNDGTNELEENNNVVSLEEAKKEKTSVIHDKVNSSKSFPLGISFEGEGKYNFKMSFPIGDKTVHFEVRPDNTFELDFSNVKFSVKDDACIVHMEGGATFNLPLSNTEHNFNKDKKAS